MAEQSLPPVLLPIGTVERETGLAKDTLRIWERRYGFPKPLRDRNGDRVYSLQEVERLRNIKRLVDNGFRPGKVIASSIIDLPGALARNARSAQQPQPEYHVAHLLALLKRHAHRELQAAMTQQLHDLGLRRFVMERIAPLNTLVGASWACAELNIYSEHLYCEFVHSVLRVALSGINAPPAPPRVLLTTLPGEPHSIGLLMAQCMLALESAETIALGVQTPIEDIAQASQSHQTDVVALSVSSACNSLQLPKSLAVLRERLPSTTQLWIGGAGASKAPVRVRGVATVGALSEIAAAVAAWRAARMDYAPSRRNRKGSRA
jgi:MerR family transcriptional regulator, light-induced transcriptional regulator